MRSALVLAAALSLGPGPAHAEDPPQVDAISAAAEIVPPEQNIILKFINDLKERLAKLAEKEAKDKAGSLLPLGTELSPELLKALGEAQKELGDEVPSTHKPRTTNLTPDQKLLLRQAFNGTVPGFEGQTLSTRMTTKSGSTSGPPKPADQQRGADAFKKAGKLAEQLKSGLASGGGDLAGPGEGASSASAAGALMPKSKSDLLLASVSGYGGSFAANGLRVSNTAGAPPEILRKDGTPATEQDLAALAAHIESEPTALMRRPDFFTVLPRAKFQKLKSEYAERPGLREKQFKHIALTPRDFQRSQSCEQLSGGCNAFARKSYRRGEDVPPEDLSAIHSDLMEDRAFDAGAADAAEKEDAEATAQAAPKGVGRAGLKSIYARLNSVIAGVQSFFGMDGASAARTSLGSAIGLTSRAGGASSPLKLAQPRKLGQPGTPGALAAAPPAPVEQPRQRVLPFLAGGVILAGLGLLRWLRNR